MTVLTQFAGRLRDSGPEGAADASWAGDAPADEALWELAPDPDTDPPDDLSAWAGVPAELTLEWLDAQAAAERGAARWFEPGGLSRPGGRAGRGFAAGGPAERVEPGAVLAGLAGRAWGQQERVSDDELVGVARAFGRLAAWASAGQLAAVGELVARRDAQVAAGADPHLAGHVSDEVAAALTLTGRAADHLVNFASVLQVLPATRAALWAGQIDRPRAWVIAEAVTGLDGAHAAAVEAAVIGAAPRQTTGQLRAACRRAVLAADPEAAARRQEAARKDARVETWTEPAGTAALAGRDLPPAEVLAADRRIDALARQLKTAGATEGLDVLRARVYTALLLGIPLQTLHTQLIPASPAEPSGASPADTGADCRRPAHPQPSHPQPGSPQTGHEQADYPQPGSPQTGHALAGHAQPGGPLAGIRQDEGAPAGPGSAGCGQPGDQVPGSGAGQDGLSAPPLPPVTGTLNLTMPLATWLGGNAPGDVPGFGPVPASDAQALAQLLAATSGTSICLTLTGASGAAVAHGCAKVSTRAIGQATAGPVPELTVTIRPLARGICGHRHEASGYRPGARLAHLVITRQPTCTFPGCRRNATHCDLDHTTPFDQGGRTCECNLTPLCRRHHKAKQAQGWTLTQTEPGHLTWTLPHGRTYRAGPDPYPADLPRSGSPPNGGGRPRTGGDP